MSSASRSFIAAFIGFVLVLALPGELAARTHPLDEDAALALLVHTLEHDKVYTRRISLDCVTYGTEETTAAYFQFVLRENHTAQCGGDPETTPVVDRYRVYRVSGRIERLEKIEDTWQPYNSAKIR
jgi:hypothetical protein